MTIASMDLQLLWAPVVCLFTSAIFFVRTNDLPLRERLLVSLPGVGFTILCLGALTISATGLSRPSLAPVFWALLAAMTGGVLLSIIRVKAGALHLLQLLNLSAAAWIGLVGTMAVTGEWL